MRLWVNGAAARQQLDRPRRDREQRHDRADRRAALRHPDGVLRERAAARPRGCCGAARRRRRPSCRARGSIRRRRRRRRDPRSTSSPRRRRCRPATWPTAASSTATAATARPMAGTIDNTAQTRDRNAVELAGPALRHARPPAEAGEPRRRLGDRGANGSYIVRVVSGDPSNFDSVFRTTVEGVLTVNGTPTNATRWIEGTATVTVTDGRLTLRGAAGATTRSASSRSRLNKVGALVQGAGGQEEMGQPTPCWVLRRRGVLCARGFEAFAQSRHQLPVAGVAADRFEQRIRREPGIAREPAVCRRLAAT